MPKGTSQRDTTVATQQPLTIGALAREIDDALKLLAEYRSTGQSHTAQLDNAGLVGLLDQCKALCTAPYAPTREPIRTIHHFACTGGTLISKCVAAMPNTQLLSEIDPLTDATSNLSHPIFAPSDLIAQARQSTRGADAETLIELFLSGLDALQRTSEKKGLRLVLRDHAHSQFCTPQDPSTRPTLREIVQRRHDTLSVITVRNPAESFAALTEHEWVHFHPKTFEEYCNRYLAFLQRHDGIPIFKYEDLVSNPSGVMRDICARLNLPYQEHFEALFDVFKLTGDSGRASGHITPRERRSESERLVNDHINSESYVRLKELLHYG